MEKLIFPSLFQFIARKVASIYYLHHVCGDAFDIVKMLRILVSTFLISVSDQLFTVKLYVTTGSAKELIE